MNKPWNYVLTSKVSHFWFALTCMVLLSLSLALKSEADSTVRVFDKAIEQLGHPTPPQMLPAAVRPATAIAPGVL